MLALAGRPSSSSGFSESVLKGTILPRSSLQSGKRQLSMEDQHTQHTQPELHHNHHVRCMQDSMLQMHWWGRTLTQGCIRSGNSQLHACLTQDALVGSCIHAKFRGFSVLLCPTGAFPVYSMCSPFQGWTRTGMLSRHPHPIPSPIHVKGF